jgi:hypothetical protein
MTGTLLQVLSNDTQTNHAVWHTGLKEVPTATNLGRLGAENEK